MMQWRPQIAAFAGVCLITGCQPPQERNDEPEVAATQSAPAVALPVAEPMLDREALLIAVLHAASKAAVGKVDEEEQRRLDGKRFQLRIRFGCEGSSEAKSGRPRRWRYDEGRSVLTVTVKPDIDSKTAVIAPLPDDAYEAVEGFSIQRPWMLTADCPVMPPPVPPTAAASQSSSGPLDPLPSALPAPATDIAIAQFFDKTDARTHRRDGRPYEATKALGEAVKPSKMGYDLVLSGRLRRLSDGRVVACHYTVPSAPPRCIISALFDSVTIEAPATGEIIAKWSTA